MPLFSEYEDVQGLVRFGHGHLIEACYVLLRIRHAGAAREWLSTAPVTSAVKTKPPPSTALHVALTADGLRALGIPEHIVSAFSPEFVAGMPGEESRARRLGDVAANSPAHWTWGAGDRAPHLVVMLFAAAGGLNQWEAGVMNPGSAQAFQTIERLPTSHLDGVEPFGFVDGISQPSIDWDRQTPIVAERTRYGNVLALGEVLLGYPNEYGTYTRRPLVDETDGLASSLPPAEEQPTARDLGRNGTYVVLRQLEQDVRGFWQAVRRQSVGAGVEWRTLAESMVGRRMDGQPLMPSSKERIADLNGSVEQTVFNQFTYATDPAGGRCPLGAHIRRANPRNADYPDGTKGVVAVVMRRLGFGARDERSDLLASTRFHRLLRRGREYGPGLSPKDALQPRPPSEPPRGLQFVCLNANLARQFEFVQSAWVMSPTFDGTHGESDPLMGTRAPTPQGDPTDGFSLPTASGVCRRLTELPRFVTVKGGAYFFMPGLRALRYLIRAGARTGEASP
jgi:deferrochelatase/peroxidase EfeB